MEVEEKLYNRRNTAAPCSKDCTGRGIVKLTKLKELHLDTPSHCLRTRPVKVAGSDLIKSLC